jgi:PAS domain S-box-containing protein
MNSHNLRHYIETLQQHIKALSSTDSDRPEDELMVALNGLELLCEEMATSEEAATVVEEELLQQNQQLTEKFEHYRTLFQTAPIAYLITDAKGLILEANQALATLLQITPQQLLRKPLAVFIDQEDWPVFRLAFHHLAQAEGRQTWQLRLSSPYRDPVDTELQVAIRRDRTGAVKTLQIAVYDLSQTYSKISRLSRLQSGEETPAAPQLPQALDGLQVLFVDDEADAREFVTAVLAAQGIQVTAVASAAAALEAIAQSRPDVLVSDIRMVGQDGYALIRRVRELEAEQGWHLPAAALTAYLDESREKTLAAGFEAHLHKLAQPDELVGLVSRLSGRVF